MRYLTFALAKGRLADITMDLLEKMGITCDEMKENSRKLIFTNEDAAEVNNVVGAYADMTADCENISGNMVQQI